MSSLAPEPFTTNPILTGNIPTGIMRPPTINQEELLSSFPADRLGISILQDASRAATSGIYQREQAHNIDHLFLIAGSTGFLVVFILSIYALRHIVSLAARWIKTGYRSVAHVYGDQDGDATAESIRRASERSLRLLLLPVIVIGTAVSGLQVGLISHPSYPRSFMHWAEFGIWVWMLLQCTALSVSPPPTARFSIAWRAGLSGIVALFLICVRSYEDLLAGNLDASLIALVGVEAFAGLVISLLCFTIPRRPDVFYNGIVIDQEFTTSLLGWISFSWTELVLRKSDRSQCLTVDDLPELNHATRGENVYRSWEEKLPRHKALSVWDLWLSVLRSHRVALAWQVIITVLLSVLSFVPQLTLLRILTLLQARQSGESSGPLWVPVVGLGLAVLTSATLETLKYWFSYNKLAIRVQQQLSLAIFHKAVRLSRVSGSTESDEAGSSQSPVNMVAVDVKNIADFLCFFFLTYESPLKIGLASVFLIYLLGWQSLLAGLVVLGLLTLFSTLAGWKYSHCQGSLMQFRDDRLRFLTEMLQGVRQIKFSAQESRWEKKTNQLRDVEMRAQWTVCSWQIAFISLYSISPILLSATCLSVYVLLSGSLSAATAFTSISVLSSIEVSMTILPDVISFLLNARVSMRRINSYLGQPEHVNPNIPSSEIKFKDAVIAWPGCRDGPGTLREMNLQFPREGLSIVTGPTGSGKSLLLASILGETDVLEGTVSAPTAAPFEEVAFPPTSQYWLMDSALAFVSQSPWLVNTTLKDNILLGLPLDPKRYAKVVFACALQEDLARLPDMDQTQVTSKGANLSGGQKWRICLARALYSRARTLVMDDIFSALDVHTREHIHQHVLGGELLRGRTCILATHHLELCMPRAKYLVRLEQGALKSATVLSPSVPGPEVDGSSNEEQEYFEPSWRNTADLISGENQIPPAPGNLEQEKENELAQNSPSIISTIVSVFLEGGSPFQWLLLGIAFFAYGGSMLGRSWWIHVWTDNYQGPTESTTSTGDNEDEQMLVHRPTLYYVSIYLALSALACAFGTCRTYFSFSTALRASRRLFRKMLWAVLRAPLQWHDTVPLGNILSRFSADFNVLDVRVGDDLHATLEYTMDVAMAVMAGAIVNPFMLIISGLLAIVYILYARRFIAASRQLKALENAAKGPVLEHIDTILSGLSTVRAYGQVDLATRKFQDNVGRHARAFWHLWLLNRWLGFRINIIGAVFSAVSAAMVAYLPNISPSMAGFAISFTIEVSVTMALSIRRYVNLEQGMNSMGRIHSYTTLQTEADKDEKANKPRDQLPSSWPRQGKLEVSRVVVRHAPHLPPVLQDVNFTIAPNTRVGVVGRTGAGKSSLVLALFRFLEASEGKIIVDDVDISQVQLEQLRSRLAIIPQHPVLFRGNVRSNLDPFGEYDDATLLAALQAVGWQKDGSILKTPKHTERSSSKSSASFSTAVDDSAEDEEEDDSNLEEETLLSPQAETFQASPLDQPILDCGENISHGQQQLLCLARAITRRPKILIMDEATSTVDKPTDDHIQRCLRSALCQCEASLLVIAHRLKTIVDSDKVLVMDNGRIVESGSPLELLQRENGCFRGMIEQDSEKETLISLISQSI